MDIVVVVCVRVITNPVNHTSTSHFSKVYEPPVHRHDSFSEI